MKKIIMEKEIKNGDIVVLKNTAELIANGWGQEISIRYGGSEFVIIDANYNHSGTPVILGIRSSDYMDVSSQDENSNVWFKREDVEGIAS